MTNCVTPFPRSETAGARLIARAWSAYHEALWRGDPAASEFAEWLAGFWEPALGAQAETPRRAARLPPIVAVSSGSSRTVGSMASLPEPTLATCCRAWRSWSNRGRGSSRPPRNLEKRLSSAGQVPALRWARDRRPGLARSSSRHRRRRHRLARQTTFHEGQRQRQYHDRTRLGHPDPDQPQYVPDPRPGDLDAGRWPASGRVPRVECHRPLVDGAAHRAPFFASILFHELAHAWVARRNGIPVLSVTLYIFGGIAQIGGKPKTPGRSFASRRLVRRPVSSSPPSFTGSTRCSAIAAISAHRRNGWPTSTWSWRCSISCLAIPSTAVASWNRSSGVSPGNRRRASGSPERPDRSLPTD